MSTLTEKLAPPQQNSETERAGYSKQITNLKTEIDNNDQFERRDILTISGPTIPTCVLSECCKKNTQLETNPDDIAIAHRLDVKPANGPDKRNIIIKLCNVTLFGTFSCRIHCVGLRCTTRHRCSIARC